MKKKIQNNELNKVAGGDRWTEEDRVTCPNCKKRCTWSSAHLYDTGGGCETVVGHYKCPECQHEWSQEQ